MGAKLSGIDVAVQLGNFAVQFEEVSISIEDGSQAVRSRGRPNGHVRGGVSASGEITLDTDNLAVIIDAAKAAGSFQELDTFDIVFNATTATQSLTIEAFECLVKMSDVLNADAKGEDKLTHKLPFEVTGKDFVRINGVPYAPESEKDYLR
jgi:hypothetical protein